MWGDDDEKEKEERVYYLNPQEVDMQMCQKK